MVDLSGDGAGFRPVHDNDNDTVAVAVENVLGAVGEGIDDAGVEARSQTAVTAEHALPVEIEAELCAQFGVRLVAVGPGLGQGPDDVTFGSPFMGCMTTP
jgi:hypothetical protein